ncbi:MAG TPA: class I SAM-dependent methyltransferase [Ktedonobacteraceae bacterium]|nr:class I SAM-dependent methyltransferase [Ktedonobacteraceae bacterium]
MADTQWYKTLFGEDYLRIYEPILTSERTQREVDGIVNLLALPQGSRMLDLCCGHGRHAIPLAQRGYLVTGQDLSEVFLHEAEKEAEAKGVHVDWVHSDMRNIPFANAFDAIINIFTAFGYLETQNDDQEVLKQVSKALKPNGLFLLETLHREALIRHFEPHMIEHHPDGLIVLEERNFDLLTSRANVKITMIYPDGERKEYGHAARVYSLTELAQMLNRAGLQVKAYFGGWNNQELTIDSFRLIVLAQKVE